MSDGALLRLNAPLEYATAVVLVLVETSKGKIEDTSLNFGLAVEEAVVDASVDSLQTKNVFSKHV